jgi:ubiquinone/menaquinone biosynthesis C-methylase UbiE
MRRGHPFEGVIGGTWDGRADAWEQVARSDAFVRLRDVLMEVAAPRPGETVLDLGSGTGLLTLAAARRACRVIALDASAEMLSRTARNVGAEGMDDVELIHGDMRRIPLPDESVDLVVSSYAFHHLGDDGKELAAAEALRVLRPGGRMVVVDMMFQLSLRGRDRRIIASKVGALLRRGPAGAWRLGKNAVRIARRRWEQPASMEWWGEMLARRGFAGVEVRALEHEAGLASATKPAVIRH